MNGSQQMPIADAALKADWFRNDYHCSECGEEWDDEWSCMCNDRCPRCDAEIEPVSSVDLSRLLTREDYLGAARLIFGNEQAFHLVTAKGAKACAEAMLEGGEARFECDRRAIRSESTFQGQRT